MRRDTIRGLYRQMLRIRLIEEGIADRYAEQEMRCPVHLCVGQEAIAAGVCAQLEPRDLVLSTHRAHGHYLAKGGSLSAMIAEIYGRATGCSGGMGGSMHLVDLEAGFLGATPIVASTVPIAVGAAFGSWQQGHERVVVAFFGDGAMEEGAVYEALNFAAVKKLPILFVCENNFYSVYSPLSVRQPAGREITALARAHGIPCSDGDGNDALRVWETARDAVEQIRRGCGPIFLEFKTYRWREHCGPDYDNELGYRKPEEFAQWRDLCPLNRLRTHGLACGAFTEAELDEWSRELQAEFDSAIRFAKDSPFPDPNGLMTDVYAVKQPDMGVPARAQAA
jgi:TPP-dependent pyruvate/acetoin dehydrogenase alpha subunit